MKIGYSAHNHTLYQSQGITASRTFERFKKPGLDKISKMIIENLTDLRQILEWNIKNDMFMYRIPTDLFPNVGSYDIFGLPEIDEITKMCKDIGNFVTNMGIRLTLHASPNNVLVSPKKQVLINTMNTLHNHATVYQLMGFEATPYNKINFHIGGAYGDKEKTKKTFIDRFNKLILPDKRGFYTIENDDRLALFTVEDLYEIYHETKIPIVFDYHHHRINPGTLSEEEALRVAASTWPEGIIPAVHYSDEKKLYEDESTKGLRKHADYIYKRPNNHGLDIDIMFESAATDLSVLKFMNEDKFGEELKIEMI